MNGCAQRLRRNREQLLELVDEQQHPGRSGRRSHSRARRTLSGRRSGPSRPACHDRRAADRGPWPPRRPHRPGRGRGYARPHWTTCQIVSSGRWPVEQGQCAAAQAGHQAGADQRRLARAAVAGDHDQRSPMQTRAVSSSVSRSRPKNRWLRVSSMAAGRRTAVPRDAVSRQHRDRTLRHELGEFVGPRLDVKDALEQRANAGSSSGPRELSARTGTKR